VARYEEVLPLLRGFASLSARGAGLNLPMSLRRLSLVVIGLMTLPVLCLAQGARTTINKSQIPADASDARAFVPKGWIIEEQIEGDLNRDATSDYILKLIEDKPARDQNADLIDRARALIVVLQSANGKLSRAAVSDKLLQCTGCGGAFYGKRPRK
jgi:hypothetical protein